MDRLQTMSIFVAVAEEAGFAAAGRRLAMSPPSVTRAISELEARLGARLLHRTTRTVQLTEAGQRYLADCRRILSDVEDADRHASGIHAAPSGLVSVTASVLFGRMIFIPALMDLLDRFPDLSVSATLVDRVVHLANEGIDVAIRIAELPDSSLTAVRVGSVRTILCASPDYLAKRGSPQAPSDLSGHSIVNFVNRAPGGEWVFHKSGKTQRFKVTSQLNLNIADVAIDAAVAGRGITRVLSYMIAPHLTSGALKLVLDTYAPPPVPVHVVHKEAGLTSARVRAVVDHLVPRLRKHPSLRLKSDD